MLTGRRGAGEGGEGRWADTEGRVGGNQIGLVGHFGIQAGGWFNLNIQGYMQLGSGPLVSPSINAAT